VGLRYCSFELQQGVIVNQTGKLGKHGFINMSQAIRRYTTHAYSFLKQLCVSIFFFKFFVSWYFEISNASAINYIINLPHIYVSILEMYGAVRKMSRKRKKKKRFAVLQALKKIGPRVEVTTA
jgi:hypothetical protein